MSVIRINFKEGFNPCNIIYIANEDSSPFQLALPKDGISDFEYIDDNGDITPMMLISDEEFDNLSNKVNIEKINHLLEKLTLLYDSISSKVIAFDIACGKSAYNSRIEANNRIENFSNIVGNIYEAIYNEE